MKDVGMKLASKVYIHSQRQKRTRSAVWQKFHEIRDAETDALVENFYFCLQCEAIVHSASSDGNTNAFHRHECIESDQEMGVKKRRKKTSNKNIIFKDEDKAALKIASAKFVCKDLRPFHAIDCPGTFDLCSAAMKFGQKYPTATDEDLKKAMPSRNTTKAAVEEIANSVREKIKSVLEKSKVHGGFAATTDSWTDNHMHTTYICVVVHAKIVTEFKIKKYNFVIHTNEITDLVKTKEVIVNRLIDVFAEYGLNADDVKKFITFVTDRGSNFRYGLIDAGFERLSCYDHLLHNMVSTMLKHETMVEIISNASKLTSYIKNSGLNSKLKPTLKLYTVTRWNSILIMLMAILINYDDIIQILNEKQRATKKTNLLDMITCLNRDILSAVCTFLKPFKEMSNQLEGDYDTLHMVWPVYLNIQRLLAQDFDYDDTVGFDLIEEIKNIGRQYFNSNANDFKPSLRHKIATVLNPPMRKLPIISPNDRELVYDEIQRIIDDSVEELVNVTVSPRAAQAVPSISTNPQMAKIPEFLQNFYTFNEESVAEKPSELRCYLDSAIPMPSTIFDADDWWWRNKNEYPRLFNLFLRVSCIPATSASSERDFSVAGLLVDERRSLILPKNVQNIIIARNRFKK